MQTQQVFGVSGGGMLYSAKNVTAKSGDSGFEQLIQMSQNTGAANEQTARPEETKKDTPAESVKAEQPEKMSDVSTETKDAAATAEDRPELKKAEGTEEATDVEAAERAAGILNQVTEAVKEILGLSEEELNQFLEELGITNLDLLQPESLQNLVLKVNSEQDAVVLLTDAQLLTTVNELTTTVDQILQEAGITPEELMSALEEPEFAALVEEALEKLSDNPEEETEESTTVENMVSLETSNGSEEKIKVEISNTGKEAETGTKEQNAESSTEVDNFAGQFVQNLQQAAEEIGEINGQTDLVQMIREIADQILEKVRVSITPETTSLEIVMTPEELGKVNLTVSADQDGMMKAKFVTENELAREAIERNMVQFKEMLQEQGFKVDTIEVTVGNFEFDRNGQTGENAQEEKKNGNRGFLTEEEISQKDDADQLAKVFMDGGESTVNYMA